MADTSALSNTGCCHSLPGNDWGREGHQVGCTTIDRLWILSSKRSFERQLLEGKRAIQLGHLINDWRLANMVSANETLGCFAKKRVLDSSRSKSEVVI